VPRDRDHNISNSSNFKSTLVLNRHTDLPLALIRSRTFLKFVFRQHRTTGSGGTNIHLNVFLKSNSLLLCS